MKMKSAKFGIGDVVRHRVYPFRGVVFDVEHPVALFAGLGGAAASEEVRPIVARAMPRANVRVAVVQHHLAALENAEEGRRIDEARLHPLAAAVGRQGPVV